MRKRCKHSQIKKFIIESFRIGKDVSLKPDEVNQAGVVFFYLAQGFLHVVHNHHHHLSLFLLLFILVHEVGRSECKDDGDGGGHNRHQQLLEGGHSTARLQAFRSVQLDVHFMCTLVNMLQRYSILPSYSSANHFFESLHREIFQIITNQTNSYGEKIEI